jgi:hypothetical protein
LVVVHFEDEPWDLTYILTDLRETILSQLRGRDESCELVVGPNKPGSYPCRSSLSWRVDGQQFEIIYWFIESIEQLETAFNGFDKDLKRAGAFIIDVIRPTPGRHGQSVWRETVHALGQHISDLADQVRLYTAFDVEDADERDLASLTEELRQIPQPRTIPKGDPELLDFILSKLAGQ